MTDNIDMQSSIDDGSMELMDGSHIPVFKTPVPADANVDNEPRLDTTGSYFSTVKPGKEESPEPADRETTEKEQVEFFLKHLFFFISHRKEICEDSRMFLSPVPVHSGLAYSGTSGFSRPTLGIYMEFFENCPKSAVLCGDGKVRFVWHIAGSPLTGSNKCSIVGADGVAMPYHVMDFRDLWPKFIEINKRYDSLKSGNIVNTLEEVYLRLKKADNPVDIMDSPEILAYKDALAVSEYWKEEIKKDYYQLKEELKTCRLSTKLSELKELYSEYLASQEQNKMDGKYLREKKTQLKAQLRNKEIDNKTYQKSIGPINKKLDMMKYGADLLVERRLEELFPGSCYRLSDLESFMRDKLG